MQTDVTDDSAVFQTSTFYYLSTSFETIIINVNADVNKDTIEELYLTNNQS